ncbi:MAG: UPF0182 family protein [Gemmatimonadales bacterium]
MSKRGRWAWATAICILAALLLGRWLAVTTANSLWFQSIGLAKPHADIARIRFALLSTAFAVASVWCIGNLYFVYRAVGSVQVPRKLGNLEILEELPRRHLIVGTVALGFVIAAVLSHDAGNWWYAQVLSHASGGPDLRDPILGREFSYYLFRLPWYRTIHSFVTTACGTMLVVTSGLYATIGAVRWSGRRLKVNELARVHIAVLLAGFALVLFWGYRLEPAEYVAGIPGTPYDSVLVDIRLPVARLLSSLALVVCGASIVWVWSSRIAVIVAGWSVLLGVSVIGHYVVPGFAGTVRSPDDLVLESVASVQPQFTDIALGPLSWDTLFIQSAQLNSEDLAWRMDDLGSAPIWDEFALWEALNRSLDDSSSIGYSAAKLDVYRAPDGTRLPVLVAAHKTGLNVAGGGERKLLWSDVHTGSYAYARGAVAVSAADVGHDGGPRFIPDLTEPDSTVAQLRDLRLAKPELMFAPMLRDFAVVPAPGEVSGVRADGLWRRLALAWTLQSPRLATTPVAARSSIVWHRDISPRLHMAAPFADFGEPWPVVSGEQGRVLWMANGYVKSRLSPLSVSFDWNGEEIRYLRAGMIGVVDAYSGETSVYLLPEPDPLSAAWFDLAGGIVQPADRIPRSIMEHIQYPRDLFRLQVRLLSETGLGNPVDGRPAALGPVLTTRRDDPEPFWWFGPSAVDPVPHPWLGATIETGDPPVITGLAQGAVKGGRLEFGVVAFSSHLEMPGASRLARRFARLRWSDDVVAGPLKTVLAGTRVLHVQSLYSLYDSVPGVELTEVVVASGSVIAQGRTLLQALDRVKRAELRPPNVAAGEWTEARMWFERMETARLAGSWADFGRAYQHLQDILLGPRDSGR